MKLSLATLLIVVFASAAAAQHLESENPKPSPYAGQEGRGIKGLSDADMSELRRGGGWGLAKTAELNGVPGPAHLLELKDMIPLRADQVAAVEAMLADMRAQAIAEGERLIARESALDLAFRTGDVTEESLRLMLVEIGESLTQLRYIHLSRHLATTAHLTEGQIGRYADLRGYSHGPTGSAAHGAAEQVPQ